MMATPYNGITPELLQSMLGLSEQDQEKLLLQKQLYMGNMLGAEALQYRGQAGGVGGALNAAAQGMMGYGAGKQLQKFETGTIAGMKKRKEQREAYYKMLIGDGPKSEAPMSAIPPVVPTMAGAAGNVPLPPNQMQETQPYAPNMVPGGAMPIGAARAAQQDYAPTVARPGVGMPNIPLGTEMPYKDPYPRVGSKERAMHRFFMDNTGGRKYPYDDEEGQ